MKRIIVEGVDGSGKTTLIEGLRREFHFLTPVVNTLRSEQDFDKWWPEQMEKDWGDLVPIHDRFYYSELVYGPIIRGELLGDRDIHRAVRDRLRREAFLIYMRPSLSSVIKESQVNEQMDGVHDHITELLEGYDKIMAKQPLYYGDRYIVVDWRFKSDQKIATERVERYLLG